MNFITGLQNGEDNFSNFVSGPTAINQENQKQEITDSSKKEEESFFNQVLPAEKEKVKLDKDSILALYGSAPQNTFNQFTPAAYNQGTYPTAFGGFPQQQQQQPAFPVQNGVSQMPPQWTQQQWGKQGQFPTQNQVPYAANPMQYPATNQFAQPQYQGFTQPSMVPGQMYQQPLTVSGGFSQPNPFFGTQNVQQQFSNMSLGNQTANTSNVWQ